MRLKSAFSRRREKTLLRIGRRGKDSLSLYLETMAFCYLRGVFAAQEKNG